jgi:hypothetical protein
MPQFRMNQLKDAIRFWVGDDVYAGMNNTHHPILLYKQHEIACLEAFKFDNSLPPPTVAYHAQVLREWKIHVDSGGYYNEE